MIQNCDVIVIGAGVAGLAAARKLAEAGASTLVLEARNRVGGRIHTLHSSGEIVELGAEFIHGKPPELWSLVNEAGLETDEVAGIDVCLEDGELHECQNMGHEAFRLLDPLKNWQGQDIPFSEYLADRPLSDSARAQITGYVEGFNAADASVIGVAALGRQQAAEESIQSDRAFRIRDGYGQISEFLARKVQEAGGKIIFGSVVQDVAWRRGEVMVRCKSSQSSPEYLARRAVIALPLGVLQSGAIRFTPAPDALREATRLRMGNVCRFTLLFREKFWAKSPHSFPRLSFLFAASAMPPVWWTAHPVQANTLTGWVGGPRSRMLATLTEADLAEKACSELAAIFSCRKSSIRQMLVRCHSHPWNDDPFSAGAYGYVPAGAIDASVNMTVPAEDTLFFAGEHTDTTDHWGTVHAALRSGHRAADQVVV